MHHRHQADRAEQERQKPSQHGAENAKAWWDSGRTYYIVKLSLGGTVAGWTMHVDTDGDDVSGILQQIEAVGWHLDDIGSGGTVGTVRTAWRACT